MTSNPENDYPLYVSMTTLPSRISLVGPTIDSLLNQTIKPDRIFICLPQHSLRENCDYEIPAWLEQRDQRIQVIRCERDFGPGTKLMACLPYIRSNGCLVIVDDDQQYMPSVLEGLYCAQKGDPNRSFSFWVHRIGLLTFGQGANGFSFHIPNLQGIEAFADIALKNEYLFVIDDQWISFFLMNKGLRIESLRHTLDGPSCISTHDVKQLRYEEGSYSRRNAIIKGAQYMFNTNIPRPSLRFRYYLTLIVLPFINTTRSLVRAIRR